MEEKKKTMTFGQAMDAVAQGRRVTKLEWKDPGIYLVLSGGFLAIKTSDGLHILKVSDGDMLGTDWVLADLNA